MRCCVAVGMTDADWGQAQVGTARFLGEDVAKVHDPVWGVIGTLGDSQCYLGVRSKVDAVHAALAKRIHTDDLPVRLIAPAFTLGVSDGQLNGTTGCATRSTSRELVNDSTEAHLKANDMAGVITVVACDKPPVGTLVALLEHNASALMLSDGSIHPGIDPVTGEPIDLVTRVPVRGRSQTLTSVPASRCTRVPARAAAAACSRTTPCRRSSACSAWNRCTWSPRPPTTSVARRRSRPSSPSCSPRSAPPASARATSSPLLPYATRSSW